MGVLREKTDEKWYYILAKDESCQGYFLGGTKEDACLRFGMSIGQCYIEEVKWDGNEFVSCLVNQQLKLL